VFGYAGNKRNEVEQLYYITERVDLYDMEYIVEPCTSAMSYYIHTLHPLEFKYVLNDNNQHLIELYNILKDTQWKYL
jgi:site-specific DNA-adenine methylase